MRHLWKKALSIILSLILLTGLLPLTGHAEDEEPTLTVKSGNYAINEPIIVTASGGAWVGVYKTAEVDITTTPGKVVVQDKEFFYRVEADGKPHNIYDGIKGDRGSSFIASIPQMDLRICLFADEGTDNIILYNTARIHINSTTSTSSLSVLPEITEGDPVEIQVQSDNRDAWVGIYEGTFTASDTFTDRGIEDFYVCYAENSGKAVEGLAAGAYTAVLFKSNGYSVDKTAPFKVLEPSVPVNPLFTDKDEYDIEDPIQVTTNYYKEGAWAGLYEAGATFDPEAGGVTPLYRYDLSPEQPQVQNILEGTALRPDDYKPGAYQVVVFEDSGYDKMIASKEITVILKEKGTITTDKAKYKVNEPILVTTTGGKWVGAYKRNEVPSVVKEGYFYRFTADDQTHNLYSGEKGERPTSFIASLPASFPLTIFLFGDEGYDNILAEVHIQTTSGTDPSVLEVDPSEYQEGDDVYVKASSNVRDAWVGLYSGFYAETDTFDAMTPVEMFYVANKDNAGSWFKGLPSGFYTAVLFAGSGYTAEKAAQFTIEGSGTAPLSTDHDSYEIGNGIFVTTNYQSSGAWVGLFLKDEFEASVSSAEPLYRYDLSDQQPESRNILEATAVRPNDYREGTYLVALFKDAARNELVATKEITVKKPKTEVYTEATCEGYGYEKVSYQNGDSYYRVVDPLGHDYGEWVFDAETHTHTRTCKRDTSHTETEWCSVGEGVIQKEATFLKPGLKSFTCPDCGGTYTEEYETEETLLRTSGSTRYRTAIQIADQLKTSLGVRKFDAVVLVSGVNYPDALAGAYMASRFSAPILLIRDNKKDADLVVRYIKNNLASDGTVYILGGTLAIPAGIEELLKPLKTERISGGTRYDTNLAILKKTDIGTDDILICTGEAFADSLSASALNRPILLVKDKLNAKQTAFLKAHTASKYYILGGTGAVSEKVEAQIKEIHEVKRISGSTRYATSTAIAREFFGSKLPGAVLAYGENFPDGLCGGPLAIAEGLPLILTRAEKKATAKTYFTSRDIRRAIVLGGEALISDETAEYILAKGQDSVKMYKIRYVLNGGTNDSKNPLSYAAGAAPVLEDPRRTGYLFDGWYTDESFSIAFSGFTPATAGDLTLFAKWKEGPLNITVTGLENMIWSWWYTPQVISADGKIFWGFAENTGYSGIAQYDTNTGKTIKTFLKHVTSVDDHNGVALTLLDDGRILSSFAGGHNKDNLIHIRISNDPYNAERFDQEVLLVSSGKTCYSQIIQWNGKIYLFYRVNNNNWAVRESTDGVNWSAETILVTSGEQYYCKFVPTTQDGLFRIVMYANPSGKDTNIRMGFYQARRHQLLNSDAATVLGTGQVEFTNFDILIERPEGLSQRLFDVAVTDPASPRILFTIFSNSSTALNSEYYLYDAGTRVKICEGGHPLMNPKYQLGASFVGTDRIILSRNENDTDYIELYSISESGVTLTKSIYSESTEGSLRNARPIADVNGKVILWHRGYYSERGYTDFETEARMSFLP